MTKLKLGSEVVRQLGGSGDSPSPKLLTVGGDPFIDILAWGKLHRFSHVPTAGNGWGRWERKDEVGWGREESPRFALQGSGPTTKVWGGVAE